MRAGKLRHRIVIEYPVETQDSTGGVSQSWGTYAKTRAEKITSGGREFYAAQKINAETQVLFRIRHIAGLTTKMRVNHGDVYDILTIADPDGRGRELHLSCKINE